MRTLIVGALLVVVAGVAHAQPGATEPYRPPEPQPYPQPYPPPQPQPYYAQPPPPAQLTEEEQELLDKGYISPGKYVGGGVTATALGWGIGHAIQGRWGERGWIFTVGEAASFVTLIYSMAEGFACNSNCDRYTTWMMVGALGLVGFRTWEILDAWIVPPRHNRRLRDLHLRMGMPPPVYVMPYIAPRGDEGMTAGLTLRF